MKMTGWKGLRVIGGVLAAVFLGALVVLIIIWNRNPPPDSLEFETAKVCLQLIVIGFIGGFATAAVQHFQQDRNTRFDERRREDEFLRSVLERTVSAYNEVKGIRRFLDAETRTENNRYISLAIYDRYLRELNAQQLEFESLKRIAPLADQRLSRTQKSLTDPQKKMPTASLESLFETIESYLKLVIDEYQERRHLVPQAGQIPLDGYVKLTSFFGTGTFRAGTTDNIKTIVLSLQNALLTA